MAVVKPDVPTTFTLNTGHMIPAMGLGTWRSKHEEVRAAVKAALLAGYRHIDTAFGYGNEYEVGLAIKESGIRREEIWVTTKLDNTWHHRAVEGLDASLKSLGLEYVDLYLMHTPCSTDPDDKKLALPDWDFIQTWEAMQKLPSTGKTRNIGVSNFGIRYLQKLLNDPSCKMIPSVNQIELHPNHPSPALLKYCGEQGIHCTAYSCLGSTSSPLFNDSTLAEIASALGRTPQQIMLKWGIQRGTSVIPKSTNVKRIQDNLKLDGWELPLDAIEKVNRLENRFKVCGDEKFPMRMFFAEDE